MCLSRYPQVMKDATKAVGVGVGVGVRKNTTYFFPPPRCCATKSGGELRRCGWCEQRPARRRRRGRGVFCRRDAVTHACCGAKATCGAKCLAQAGSSHRRGRGSVWRRARAACGGASLSRRRQRGGARFAWPWTRLARTWSRCTRRTSTRTGKKLKCVKKPVHLRPRENYN